MNVCGVTTYNVGMTTNVVEVDCCNERDPNHSNECTGEPRMIIVNNGIEHREIVLPKGGTLHIDMTQEFIDRVRLHFDLAEGVKLTNDQIRMYVFGSVNSAINKETETK